MCLHVLGKNYPLLQIYKIINPFRNLRSGPQAEGLSFIRTIQPFDKKIFIQLFNVHLKVIKQGMSGSQSRYINSFFGMFIPVLLILMYYDRYSHLQYYSINNQIRQKSMGLIIYTDNTLVFTLPFYTYETKSVAKCIIINIQSLD